MTGRRGVGYGRVSGEVQRDNYSLETQRDGVATYAAANGITLVGWYADVDSGANRDRDQLAEAIARIRQRDADVLIVYVVDRLGRDFAHSVSLPTLIWLGDVAGFAGKPAEVYHLALVPVMPVVAIALEEAVCYYRD
jgi:hypothetical protein